MFKEKSHHILLFCAIVTIASAVLQYINPSLTFFDGGLITAILLTIFLQNDFYTRLFGGISIALVILASFYGSEDLDRKQMIFQHSFSLIIIVLAIVFVLYVKRLYRSIESDQHQFRALFEHATEGIILTDKQGEIVLLNPAASGMFGYPPEELPGQSIDVLIPKRVRHRHEADRGAFYANPGNRAMGHGRDLFAKKKDGAEFPVEVSLSYYKQRGDIFVIAFIVDITQRKQS
ncbi:MAG: PAS domain S-box protein, partial [Bacteroidetes bacterium]|nr:PAS domain S-box protein [Bacteroidota bacterium]